MILSYSFSGSAYPAYPAEWKGDGYVHEPETEQIGGAFRLVEDDGVLVVIGNGEDPERFWAVDWEAWAEASEDCAPESPPFVEAIENPIIRTGLRRYVDDMRALARRCGGAR